MSRFSRSEAEARGWAIVHESDDLIRAEKQYNGRLVNEEAHSEGLLLERINAYEQHLEGLPQAVPAPVDELGVPVDEEGLAVRSVIAPDGEALTEAEWSQRDSHDALVRDGEFQVEGGTEAAAEAAAAREDIAREKENARTAEPDVGPTENLDEDSRDRQLAERLVVREGEQSLSEVIDRKLEESANAEAARVEAGLGIGPVTEEPMGGEPELFVPEGEPAAAVGTVRAEAQEEKAKEMRDELGADADKPENVQQVREAGAEAEAEHLEELGDSEQEESEENEEVDPDLDGEAPESREEHPVAQAVREAEEGHADEVAGAVDNAMSQPEATEAAEELAKEKGVDLSQVEGSGKGGKVTKPDVESHLEADPED